MRVATKADFKVGTTLVCCEEGFEFTIRRFYSDGIWEARGARGEKCVFEGEAAGYFVKES